MKWLYKVFDQMVVAVMPWHDVQYFKPLRYLFVQDVHAPYVRKSSEMSGQVDPSIDWVHNIH